jgi:PAS domain-containing protein
MKVPAVVTLSRVRDGKYVEVNEAFCKLSGYTRTRSSAGTPTR